MTTNLRTYPGAGVGADKAVVENLDLVSRVNIYRFIDKIIVKWAQEDVETSNNLLNK